MATEVEDELAVAVDADDVALVAGEDASEDAELDMPRANFSKGSLRKVTRSGLLRNTVMKGCITAFVIDAGALRERSFTRWYWG